MCASLGSGGWATQAEAETLTVEIYLGGAFLWVSDGGVASLTFLYKPGSSSRPVWIVQKTVSAQLPAGKRGRTLMA